MRTKLVEFRLNHKEIFFLNKLYRATQCAYSYAVLCIVVNSAV